MLVRSRRQELMGVLCIDVYGCVCVYNYTEIYTLYGTKFHKIALQLFKNNCARNQVDVNQLFSFDVKTHISNLVWEGSHTDYFVLSTLLVL